MGIGMTPSGTGPVGFDLLENSQGGPVVPLLDAQKSVRGSRYVDANTGDYVYSEGLAVGEANTRHRVRLAMLTELGSSADSPLGIAPPGGVISPDVLTKLDTDARAALSRLVAEKRIEIVSITVDASVRPVRRTILWRDLKTNTLDEMTA